MNHEAQSKIIGLSGTFASGKDTLSEFLVEHGFLHIPTSQMLSEEAMRTFGNTDRPAKAAVAERLRKEQGGGVLAKLALAEFARQQEQYTGVVISGLRATDEAVAIKEAGGNNIFVDAPLEIRYQRMTGRNRDAEAQITLEEFKQREQKEWHAGDSGADFNLRDVKAGADLVITNDSTYEDFIKKTEEGLEGLGIKL